MLDNSRWASLISNALVNELTNNAPNAWEQIQIYSFPQIWNSTSCGFGGIGGGAMKWAQTTVVLNHNRTKALVYINDKPAYSIMNPNATFWLALDKCSMLGAGQYTGQYSRI